MFTDRADAGRRLSSAVVAAGPYQAPVVLALPRGGVPVALPVAAALRAPLDVLVVRKLGAPGHPELAVGAIGPGGVRILDTRIAGAVGADESSIARVEARELDELRRREQLYRPAMPALDLSDACAIVVDDGVATGATASAACRVARGLGASRVVLAVPVAPSDWRERLGRAADCYIAVEEAADFWAVGAFYRDFSQTTDAEVLTALGR